MREAQRRRTQDSLQAFLETPLDALLPPRPPDAGEQAALELFQRVAETVPAYRAFLSEQGIAPESVQSFADFQRLPPVTKENYILRHPLADLCRGGQLEGCDMIAVSSGSTGKPTFWPRFLTDELGIAVRFEQIFRDSFQVDTRRTLAVVCFALGTWVGGMYTASCCRHLAAKGYPLTVITPGNNKDEILRVVTELGPAFEQVVLLGYPPFLKDVVDTGLARGVDWSDYGIRMVLAGEVFSEEWRTLVAERVGAEDPVHDFASLYGTADAGVLGNETPLSIAIRRFLAERPDAARDLFGEARLPTLAQYDPLSRFFEARDGSLLFSGDNGIPLIRYAIHDTGGILPYNEMLAFLRQWGFDPLPDLERRGTPVRPLPFVWVFGRGSFAVSYFGANVYPENVAVGLEQPGIREWVTGKFVLEVRHDNDSNPFLALTVELAPGEQADEERRRRVAASVARHIARLNSEFAHYVPAEYRLPVVEFAPTGDPDYFPVGVKHRYTRR